MEDVLGLSGAQLTVLVQYILEEAAFLQASSWEPRSTTETKMAATSGKQSSPGTMKIEVKIEDAISSAKSSNTKSSSSNMDSKLPAILRNRMPLLKACICDDHRKVKEIVGFLDSKIKTCKKM